MQRYGNDYIGFIKKVAAGAVEPADEARNQIEPVGMLERQDGTAALIVLTHDRARPVERRRIGEAGCAERFAARVQKVERTAYDPPPAAFRHRTHAE